MSKSNVPLAFGVKSPFSEQDPTVSERCAPYSKSSAEGQRPTRALKSPSSHELGFATVRNCE